MSLKIGMVALKARKNMIDQSGAIGCIDLTGVTSPNQGYEIEYLIDQIKSLQSV